MCIETTLHVYRNDFDLYRNDLYRNDRKPPVQTPYFTWTESNANEEEQRIFLICIRFGSREARGLNLASTFIPMEYKQYC